MPLSDICNNGNNQSYRWTKTTNSAQKEDFRYIYIVSTHFYLFLYVITTLHATVWVWRIIYIRSEGKWNNATNCTMTFTKKITVKTSIKMVGWGYTDHRVWFMAGQLNKGQSLYIKHKDHKGGISTWSNCAEVLGSQGSSAVKNGCLKKNGCHVYPYYDWLIIDNFHILCQVLVGIEWFVWDRSRIRKHLAISPD